MTQPNRDDTPALPRNLTFEITSRCNFRCRMCYYTEEHLGAKRDALSLDDIRVCVTKLPETIRNAYLIGGEPLLRKDIVEIAAALAERGIAPTIITNGYLLTGGVLDRLRAAGVRPTFEISLDGPPRVHNDIRGRADAFERTLANATAAYPEFPVIFTSVLQKDNHRALLELPGLLRHFEGCLHVVQLAREWSAADRDASLRALDDLRSGDSGGTGLSLDVRQDAGVSPTALPRNLLLALMREMEAEGRRNGIRTRIKPAHLFDTYPLLFGADDNRHLGRFRCNQMPAMRLDAEGNVLFCYALRSPLGNLVRQSFGEIWADAPNRCIRSFLAHRRPPLCGQCTAHLDYDQPAPPAPAASAVPLRLGLAGTGRIAGVYARIAAGLPDMALTSVCGSDPARTTAFALEHGLGAEAAFTSPTELAAHCDAVLVAGLPADRPEQCRAMPDTPLLLEKPLAHTLEAAMGLAAMDEAAPGVMRQNVFPLRHTAWAQAMRDFADSPDHGAPAYAAVYRATPLPPSYYANRPWRRTPAGSPLWNMLIHELDLLLLWYGMPSQVTCTGDALSHDVAYDTAVLRLDYADGFRIHAAVSTSDAIPAGRALLVQRARAAAHFVGDTLYRVDGPAGPEPDAAGQACRETTLALDRRLNAAPERATVLLTGPTEDEDTLCRLTLARWAEHLRLGHAPGPTLFDGALRVILTDACHCAMRNGAPVDIPDITSAHGGLPCMSCS